MDTCESIIRDVEFLVASGVHVHDIATIDDIRLLADGLDAMPVPTVACNAGFFALTWSASDAELLLEFHRPGRVRVIYSVGNCWLDEEVDSWSRDLLGFIQEMGE